MGFGKKLVFAALCALWVGCASGDTSGTIFDAAPGDGGGAIDAAAPIPDAGEPKSTCEACTANHQCPDDHVCATIGDTQACVPACSESDPTCPDGFMCGGIKMTFCAPLDGLCCIDGDDDTFGTGVDCAGPDCNDDDPDINPDADDVCNAVDDDCDPATVDGSADPALGGDCDGADTDLCEEGLTYCEGGELLCDDVTGDILDLCDGMDNDCNPATLDGSDDPAFGMACDSTGDPDLCFDDQNICNSVLGMIQCQDLAGGAVDLCNGLDDDCNPSTNDGDGDPAVGVSCDGGDTDLCNEGTTSCVGGAVVCGDMTGDNLEICNGFDDDCNPSTLDGVQDPLKDVPCDGGDSDMCTEGTYFCAGGGSIQCSDTTGNTVELCDGFDNDCDGAPDEDPASTMCVAEHGSPPGVTSWSCSGTCTISGCSAGLADVNGLISDGCECTGVDSVPGTCSGATGSPVSVGLDATVKVSGKIETVGGSDWYRFNFTNRASPAIYHPAVQLTGGLGEFKFDVQTSCSTAATCAGGGETSSGITNWEGRWNYTAGPGCCSDTIGPNPLNHITTVYVRVFRTGSTATCNAYELTATNANM